MKWCKYEWTDDTNKKGHLEHVCLIKETHTVHKCAKPGCEAVK